MQDSKKKTFAIVVIAVTFGAVAVWAGWGIARGILDAWAMRNSVVVTADLLDVERRTVHAGDGSAERITVRYRYEFDGLPYVRETDRLSVFARDSDLFDAVEDAFRKQQPVKCYVDPDQPSRSFFSLRFTTSLFLLSLLFPVFFGIVSAIAARELVRRHRAEVPLSRQK